MKFVIAALLGNVSAKTVASCMYNSYWSGNEWCCQDDGCGGVPASDCEGKSFFGDNQCFTSYTQTSDTIASCRYNPYWGGNQWCCQDDGCGGNLLDNSSCAGVTFFGDNNCVNNAHVSLIADPTIEAPHT